MRNKTFALTSLTLALALAAPAAFADNVMLPSRVDAATVFPAGVSVHRVGHVRLPAGEHQVVFYALPTDLTDDTVRVGGFGQGATAEAVTVRSGRLAEATGPDIARLEAQLVATQRERAEVQRRREETARQRGPLAPVDARLAELATREQQQGAALAQARAEGERVVKYVAVDVSTVREGELTLSVEYMVPSNASWRPSYAAHLDGANGRVGVDVFATLQQNTGEDWTGIRLSVSTVVPGVGLALPTLDEHQIELEPVDESMEAASGMRRPRAMPMPTSAADIPGADMVAPARRMAVAPEPPPAPMEFQRATTRAHVLSARLEVPTPVTVRSGAPPRRVLAAHLDVEAELEHRAAPRQSSSVYLAARFHNSASFPLLAGPVALFIGTDFVGSAALGETGIDEEVLLPFGIDAGVTIDRTAVGHQLAQHGGRDDTTVRYQYRLSNHRERPVNVTVFEQMPVSHSQGLSVRLVPGDAAPQTHHEGDAPGVVRWAMHVAPGATSRWSLGYVVSAPHRRTVNGEIE